MIDKVGDLDTSWILKHCPFCGCGAHWCRCGSSDKEHEGCHQISCPNCGNFDFANGDDKDCETLEELREHCAAKWNSRL